MSDTPVRSTVRSCLRDFLDSTGRTNVEFRENSHLIRDLGLSSDEGVDFVLDLCNALRVELPQDFNPFIHESGDRGRRVSEMIERVEHLVASAGTAA